MKLGVIGSRTLIDEEIVFQVLDSMKVQISAIITGGAKGADQFAEKWAIKNNIPTIIYLPDWANDGKSAAMRRNRQIAKDCEECLAFWDGISKGTKSTIEMCQKLDKKVRIISL
jgi:predicted Rossmann fold nucleotide-binding protein DprA/Smf involved in DNA uptake